jgi:hypothetical protein
VFGAIVKTFAHISSIFPIIVSVHQFHIAFKIITEDTQITIPSILRAVLILFEARDSNEFKIFSIIANM